ncbi:MAG TPA: alpha/beta fold hydrolase [Streptosporangiaceae bacterium]|nr:alpha/beta fold hydrolase [Streptosporangiaceae bacterium]
MYPQPQVFRSGDRLLAVEDAGPATGLPVLVHNGDGSRHIFPPAAREAAQAGFRLISYDRPGCGLSTAVPGRTIADCAQDLQVIIDRLGISRAAAWGSSGGGPYALASAALLPGVFTAVCLFAPIGPYGAAGLDFTAGMGWADEAREQIDLFFSDPARAQAEFLAAVPDQLARQSDSRWWLERWGARALQDAAHSQEWADHLAACATDSSGGGWWDDWTAVLRPWGFGLSAVEAPVALWQGSRDEAVPAAHARWIAATLPRAELHLAADEDHTNVEENNRSHALAWLGEVARGPNNSR